MSGFDLQQFALDFGLETKAYVGRAIAAAMAERDGRIKALEDVVASLRAQVPVVGPAGPAGADGARGLDGKDGCDGKDVDMLAVKSLVEATVASVERPDVGALVRAEVVTAMAALPTPKDGRDGINGRDGVDGKDGLPGLAGKDGLNGRDAAPVDIGLIVDAIVAMPDVLDSAVLRYLTAHPPKDGINGKDGAKGEPGRDGIDGKDGAPGLAGKDGRDGLDGKDGAPGLAGKDGRDGIDGKDGAPGLHGKDGRDGIDGKDGAPGLQGKDGIGVMGLLIDRDRHLIATMSDGATKDVGEVVGKDGKDVEMADVARLIQSELATWERPKDGAPGLDGKDGLGFDDVSLEFDEAKGYFWRLANGDRVKEFRMAAPWYAGVWQSGRKYPHGARVTSKGHEWTAKVDTFGKPGQSPDWQLSTKGGRDGKDAPGARDE